MNAGVVGGMTAHIFKTLVKASTGNVTGPIIQINDGTPLASGENGINAIEATLGSVTGDVTAARRIGTISAPNGIIGVPGSPPTPINIEMTSAAGMGGIRAEAIYAAIDLASGTGSLGYLEATVGDFVGSLWCSKITGVGGGDYGLDVTGHLDAEIDHDANAMEADFRIGGSLLGDILLPDDGLTKQIIVKGNGTSGSWTGAVKLNGSAISHDSNGVYTVHQDTLGGGAVGLSAFRFHPEGCDPPNGDTVPQYWYDPGWIGEGDPPCESANDFEVVLIRHFGPVRAKNPLPEGTDAIYTIWATFVGCGGDFPCAGSFDVTDEFNINPGADPREIAITRKSIHNGGVWDPDFEYHIELQQSETDQTTLESVDVTGNPQVPYYVYWIALPGCPYSLDTLYDQNGDDSLTESDLSAWPGINADVSRDGNVTTFDLYKLLCGQIQRSNLP